MDKRYRARGFTLTELMIAVAIVGILAAFALPTYNASVNKSRRAECRAALVLAAQNEERYFTNNNGYSGLAAIGQPQVGTTQQSYSGNSLAASACTLLAYAGTTGAIGTALSATAASPSLVIIATPANGFKDTQCNAAAYAMDSTGNFAPLDTSNGVVTPPANCF